MGSELTRAWRVRLGRKLWPRKPTSVENCLQGTVARTELGTSTYQALHGTILIHTECSQNHVCVWGSTLKARSCACQYRESHPSPAVMP